MSLFPELDSPEEAAPSPRPPLAERLRPATFEELVGQGELVGPGGVLRRLVEAGSLPSMVLWGPPGSGKTTLARLLAGTAGYVFDGLSGAVAGKADVTRVVGEARKRRAAGRKTLLFVDEIHRFNKAQQDAFLPHVEEGLITLVGATTENPSFEVIAPLLSRCRVFLLRPLAEADLERVLARALADRERGLEHPVELEPGLDAVLARLAAGDARKLLTLLELLADAAPAGPDGKRLLRRADLAAALQRDSLAHDRAGDAHFDCISALHKSVRSGDPDATLYWLARMLEAGEDRLYVGRRLVRMAVEDVGTADPHALTLAISAVRTFELLGTPEGELALAELAVYLALAPKSNAVYRAYGEAVADVKEHGALPVPLVLRNAPTGLMRDLGWGKGYKYAHDYEDAVVLQEHMPEGLSGRRYFHPGEAGFEKELARRLAAWLERRRAGEETRKPGQDGWKGC